MKLFLSFTYKKIKQNFNGNTYRSSNKIFNGKGYGYIETNGDSHSFTYGKKDRIKFKKQLNKHDIIKYHFIDNEGRRCVEIIEIQNSEEKEKLLVSSGDIFFGYLKKIRNKFYVKQYETKLLIPIKSSVWERDPFENYSKKDNEIVKFFIKRKKTEAIFAELLDVEYTDEYYKIASFMEKGEILTGVVVYKSDKTLSVYFKEHDIRGFARHESSNLKYGSAVRAKIQSMSHNQTGVSISIEENK